ncbi:MAG: hypothetical protein KH703_01890 [Campylobacter gracilis]|uniref:hypothetical protein n=1 Tax=Campylobacter gracilis TaxID=824 RepID=UPI0026EA626E|nr:hypothetical protein [Campylobacter gracilis]MBS6152157.1 hypothetical protein [Campylobacter gracilis]
MMKMRKGAAVGGGVSGIIFLAIIIFVIVKIIYPKLSGAKDEVLAKAYAVELERAFKDIQRDYLSQGGFRALKSMVSSTQFSDSDLERSLAVNQSFTYGVGPKSKKDIVFCATITLRQDNEGYFLETSNINRNRERCEAFHNDSTYKKLNGFRIGK